MIGMGIRLDRMADIRRLFGRDPDGSDRIGKAPALPAHCLLPMKNDWLLLHGASMAEILTAQTT